MNEDQSMSQTTYRSLYGEPADYVVNAHAPCLEETTKQFIRASTFIVLSSLNEAGYIDMSPRGGQPGFIQVLDDKHIAFLDEMGNKKLHTISNLEQRNQVGMLFMIPGVKEVLRAYGVACAIHDEATILQMGGNLKRNKSFIRIRIEKIFPHCSTALTKASLWDSNGWPKTLAKEIPSVQELGASIAKARRLLEASEPPQT